MYYDIQFPAQRQAGHVHELQSQPAHYTVKKCANELCFVSTAERVWAVAGVGGPVG